MIEAIPALFVLFFSIVFHEYAHGWVAYRLGDPTARDMGRLTLNPLAHIDPIGSVILPLGLLLTGSRFLFGWAKPVPINPRYFQNPTVGMAITGAAGPASNLILAFIAAVLLRLFGDVIGNGFFFQMLKYGVLINVVLAVFNLVPIPPLDGSRVIIPFVPKNVARFYWEIERYGMFIVLGLLVTGILWKIITPFIVLALTFYSAVAGL